MVIVLFLYSTVVLLSRVAYYGVVVGVVGVVGVVVVHEKELCYLFQRVFTMPSYPLDLQMEFGFVRECPKTSTTYI
jgi:hypothetical protein